VSPVIILGLVLMWAVVLVPMWLRRHDEVEESRSVDRFSTAMHTLSRHEGRPAQRNVRATSRNPSAEVHVHVSGASAPDAVAARRRRGLARRRSRMMMLLAVTTVAVLGAAVALGGMLFWIVQVMLDLVAVAYATHLRRMAILAAASRRRAVARRRGNAELDELEREPLWDARNRVQDEREPLWEEGITVHRGPIRAATVAAPVYASAAAPASAELDDVFDQTSPWDEADLGFAAPAASAAGPARVRMAANDGFFDQETDLSAATSPRPSFIETGAIPASSLAAEPEAEPDHEYASDRAARAAAHAAADARTLGGKPWEPIAVPRPTYSMKPVAPSRPVRQTPPERLLPPVERTAELEADDNLEAILDRRWAVND
jgi:hypothetical protein